MITKEKMEYKCPKCLVWDDGFPIEDGKKGCTCCGYTGDLKEFEAKKYDVYIQTIIQIVAFNKKDAKKETELYFRYAIEDEKLNIDKIIKIEEN